MNDKLDQTQRILRSPKVTTDERGRTVWIDPVETGQFELVSTQMLKQLIESGDANVNNDLRKIAEGDDGLLARDTDKDQFEVINDAELQQILDGADLPLDEVSATPVQSGPSSPGGEEPEELELVSTQLLRVVLNLEDDESESADPQAESGFNPYNSG